MQNKNNIKENEENDFISSLKKKNPFSVPENYFEFFPQEIAKTCHPSKINTSQKIFFLFQPKIAYSFAAITVLLVAILLFINKGTISSSEGELSTDEITYILQNPDQYNIEESLITEGLLASFESSSDEIITTGFEISDEEVQTYLEDNWELNSIINEL